MDHTNVHSWFPAAISHNKIEDPSLISDLNNKAITLKTLYASNATSWRCSTFNTLDQYDWKTENDPSVVRIIELCTDKVSQFSSYFGVDNSVYFPECTGFWFNVAAPQAYQEYHQHHNSHFSLSFYLETPENSGNIVFKSFESVTDMFPLPIDEKNLNEFSYKTCSYRPSKGMLLIFRSNLLHMVEQNLSKENRISISMNYILKRL
jgi:uncharacterized protein (TIGR02466 family)